MRHLKKIAEALINPKLQEGFLNMNKRNEIQNGIIEIFNKRTTVYSPRLMTRGMDTKKIGLVPPRVAKISVVTKKQQNVRDTKQFIQKRKRKRKNEHNLFH